MDYLEFTSAMTTSIVSLGWPIAVFGSVYLFRQKLGALLPLLKVKHGETEVSFRLEQGEKEAAQLPDTQTTVVPRPPEETIKFIQLAKLSPRGAILETRANIEQAVKGLAIHAGISGAEKGPPYMLITKLRSAEVIDNHIFSILNDLRAVGNSAAHNADATSISESEALRFKELADIVLSYMSSVADALPPRLVNGPEPVPFNRSEPVPSENSPKLGGQDLDA